MTRTKRDAHKRQLTELFVKKVKPKTKAFVVWDKKQRGLAIRVQPTGARAWKVIYSRHGRPRWLHLGDVGGIGLADARTLAAEAMLDVARGKDPAADKKAERGAGTFAELAAKYVEEWSKKRNKSWKQADTLVQRYLLPRWGKLQASSITRGDVRTLVGRIEAPVLANQVLAAASAVFSWADRQEIVAGNPCRGIERNKTRSRERILSDSEVPLFWGAFDDALKVILLTGQRPGEVAHMRREHIEAGWWTLPGEPVPALGWPGTKNGATHRVWLPKAVQDIIAELGDGFVFTGSRGRPVHGLDAAMRDICKKLGAERATPHDLRRTFSSKVTGLGFGRDAMNRVTNHKEGGIGSVYDRYQYEAENKKIMETVAARIMALVKPPEESNVVPIKAY